MKKGFFLFLLALASFFSSAWALDTVSREEWGANPDYLYLDSDEWKTILKNRSDASHNQTQAQINRAEKIRQMSNFLAQNFGEFFQTASKQYKIDGRALAHPISTMKNVRKIVVHHTGTSYTDDDRTDKEIVQAIYKFHSVTRQWGDVGYNYIIGGDGKVYEGRQGGETSKGIHTSWNNDHSIGIVLLGNFDVEEPTQEQLIALIELVELLTKKYNIDTRSKVKAFRECTSGNCPDPIEVRDVDWLLGHAEAGHTACPGDALEEMLPKIRTYVRSKLAGRTPSLSFVMEKESIQKIPSQSIRTPLSSPGYRIPGYYSTSRTSQLPKGRVDYSNQRQSLKNIDPNSPARIRLSLPENIESVHIKPYQAQELKFLKSRSHVGLEEIRIAPYGQHKLLIELQGQRAVLGKYIRLESEILHIANWERKPTWDKEDRYNDNLFRGILEIRNNNGKLLIINELPVEDYLKGLAEVSNGTHPEKAKTIITAARTYMYFYTSEYTRKFPGKPYDGSDDPNEFQKYLGYGYEMRSPNITKVIEETKGEIITYQGNIIKPWYFNQSDGQTRSYKYYCERFLGGSSCQTVPFLTSVREPKDFGTSHNAHGVGISGIGADEFAAQGLTYRQIIPYYLKGTKIQKLKTTQ